MPELASYIEHTLLKPEAQPADITQLCQEAIHFGFYGVCVNPAYAQLAAHILSSSSVQLVCVVGFPLGATLSTSKAFEAEKVLQLGANEIDMVINLGAVKSQNYTEAEQDIKTVVKACAPHPVKVIIETGLLEEEEKRLCTQIVLHSGAAFVKTCTGFAKGQATVQDIETLRKAAGPTLGIKASGGIKTRENAEALLKAGATRLGCSASLQIVSTLQL